MATAPSAPGVWEVELTRLVPAGASLPADGMAGIGLSFAMDSHGFQIVQACASTGAAALSGKIFAGMCIVKIKEVISMIKGTPGSQLVITLADPRVLDPASPDGLSAGFPTIAPPPAPPSAPAALTPAPAPPSPAPPPSQPTSAAAPPPPEQPASIPAPAAPEQPGSAAAAVPAQPASAPPPVEAAQPGGGAASGGGGGLEDNVREEVAEQESFEIPDDPVQGIRGDT
ncbi:hypothetical protein T484DRAFT_1786134 [Baffinella frigidus]|nr:hypothetical protein T484DRAFT_1786134 [Cryptophyta sp. CCMP2293]